MDSLSDNSDSATSFRDERGRKPMDIKRPVILLRHPKAELYPARAESDALTSMGYGFAPEVPIFRLGWSVDQINEYIYSLYPDVPLRTVGFKMGKCDRTKKNIFIETSRKCKGTERRTGQ
jgi:hypothetical protein